MSLFPLLHSKDGLGNLLQGVFYHFKSIHVYSEFCGGSMVLPSSLNENKIFIIFTFPVGNSNSVLGVFGWRDESSMGTVSPRATG